MIARSRSRYVPRRMRRGSLLNGLSFAQHAVSFDFVPHVFPGMSKIDVLGRISDHYPLWCEFTL
jgi:hypothetical protein